MVLPTPFSDENIDCIRANLYNMTFPICLYNDDNDLVISKVLRSGMYYETRTVTMFLRLLRSDNRLQFVDIGANIGVWSLPAARLSKVISVEPNWRSMSRLAKAVKLGAVTDNITLINNGVSNDRTTFNVGSDETNQGHSFLIRTAKCNDSPLGSSCNTASSIKTIILNDLLPHMRLRAALMKVDTEGHEVYIFTNKTAGKFFDHIYVPIIFIEWNSIRYYTEKDPSTLS